MYQPTFSKSTAKNKVATKKQSQVHVYQKPNKPLIAAKNKPKSLQATGRGVNHKTLPKNSRHTEGNTGILI